MLSPIYVIKPLTNCVCICIWQELLGTCSRPVDPTEPVLLEEKSELPVFLLDIGFLFCNNRERLAEAQNFFLKGVDVPLFSLTVRSNSTKTVILELCDKGGAVMYPAAAYKTRYI